MKKITIKVGLLLTMLSTNAQDTTCTYFTGDRVIEFDYKMDTILYEVTQIEKYYEINIKHGDVLCLYLSDHKTRVRKVITTFSDGSTSTQVLDSKDNVYFSPKGAIKVLIGKPKFIIQL